MIEEGDIILFRFPRTDLGRGKLLPALLLRKIPGAYDDWLICMVSTRLYQRIDPLEIILSSSDSCFSETGLKRDSLIRSSRLAVVHESIFEGNLGAVKTSILLDIRGRLASWLCEAE